MSDSLTRLAKVLGLLGSNHAGEVANAASAAEKLRKEMNKSWLQLLQGGSSSGGSSDYLLRALRAESRVTELDARVSRLEAELREMHRKGGGTTTSSGAGSWSSTFDSGLDPEVERRLVEELTKRMRGTEWVRQFTGWPAVAHVGKILQDLASKHRLRFERPARGYYKFYQD